MNPLSHLTCIPAAASAGNLSPMSLISVHNNVATPPSDEYAPTQMHSDQPPVHQYQPQSASLPSQHDASVSSPTNQSAEHAIATSDISIAVSSSDSKEAVSPSDQHSSSPNVKLTVVTTDGAAVPSSSMTPMSTLRDDVTSSISIVHTDHTDTPEPDAEILRFEPLFDRTPLVADSNNEILLSQTLFVSVPFKPVNPSAWCARMRQSPLYSWIFLTFLLVVLFTEILLDFQNSFLWLLAYMPPIFLFMAIEFTQADLSMFKVLFWSFEAWLIWVNLLLILIFAEIGVYKSGAIASAEHTLLNNLTAVLGGFFVTTFDAFKRTKFTRRLHTAVLVIVLFAIAQVVITDQFFQPVFKEYGPVCFLYCSDTRQLAMSCARTALIFVCKQTVKFIFGGQTTSVLAFDLTYHMVEDQADVEPDEQIDTKSASESSDVGFFRICCSKFKSFKLCHSRHSNSERSMDFVIASAGTPIIQETNFSPEFEMAPVIPASVQSDSVQSEAGSDVPVVMVSPTISVSSTRRSSLKFQVPQAASRSITRDTGHVPILSAHLHYEPMCCCYSTALNAITNSWMYTFIMIVGASLLILAVSLESNEISVGRVPFFVPAMLASTFYAVCEFARLDRTLLSYLIRRFDFWFLFLSLVTYCVISAFQGNLVSSNICNPALSDHEDALRSSFCANHLFFIANFFTIVWDAAPFVGRRTKLTFVCLVCANSAFQIYNNRLASLGSFLNQPVCSVDIWVNGNNVTNTATLRLGILLTFLLFQLRYLIRQFLLPGKFAMLQIPIRISSSELE